jgi:cysteinyl-tRNA synthetase
MSWAGVKRFTMKHFVHNKVKTMCFEKMKKSFNNFCVFSESSFFFVVFQQTI